EYCSLQANQVRPAVVCTLLINQQGVITEPAQFTLAQIKSQAKLVYDQVSDYLEQQGDWQPDNKLIAQQLPLLQQLALLRQQYRCQTAVTCNERPDYRFKLVKQGQLLDNVIELRLIA